MQALDATGRKVSLLNDDSRSSSFSTSHISYERAPLHRPTSFQSASSHSYSSYPTPRHHTASPDTPELLRSDSYDSQNSSNDPVSPLTPSVEYAYPRPSLFGMSRDSYSVDSALTKRPALLDNSRSTSFEDESYAVSPMAERPGKRYPCRYRDSHGCEKTFTTSGHASRHSKIHTAEKAVQCTFAGCQKKFTRADNMKQHLETHFKDKSRSSSSQRAVHKASLAAEGRRPSAAARTRSTPAARDGSSQWDSEQYPLPTPPLPSPNGATGAWDMRGLNLPLLNRPMAGRTPSGLDALAMAVAAQAGEAS